jgi:GT2 family glycosyltransferase
MAGDPYVDIVIPTWNGWKLLEPCLYSIIAQEYTYYTITVVDNGSTDGTVEQLKQSFPDVRLVSFARNTGFSAAVNAGIKAGSHPLVFLLNNDTELARDCLGKLVEATQCNQHLFFAAKMLSFHERTLLDGAGDSYLRGGAGYRLGTMEEDGGVYNRQREVFGACAGAALYQRTFFEKVGYFDEAFFAYLEDVDINLRACCQGLSCLFVPKARVFHVGSATTGSKINSTTVRLSTRNSLFVLLKNYSLPLFIRYLPVILLYQFCWLLFCLKRGQFAAYLIGLAGVLPNIASLRRKYKKSKKQALSNAEIAVMLKKAEREVVDAIMRRRTAAGKSNGLLLSYRLLFL